MRRSSIARRPALRRSRGRASAKTWRRRSAHLETICLKKRIAFVLVAVQGLSLDEAAELLDASAETVKQRVLHARKEITARIARAAARTRPREGA